MNLMQRTVSLLFAFCLAISLSGCANINVSTPPKSDPKNSGNSGQGGGTANPGSTQVSATPQRPTGIAVNTSRGSTTPQRPTATTPTAADKPANSQKPVVASPTAGTSSGSRPAGTQTAATSTGAPPPSQPNKPVSGNSGTPGNRQLTSNPEADDTQAAQTTLPKPKPAPASSATESQAIRPEVPSGLAKRPDSDIDLLEVVRRFNWLAKPDEAIPTDQVLSAKSVAKLRDSGYLEKSGAAFTTKSQSSPDLDYQNITDKWLKSNLGANQKSLIEQYNRENPKTPILTDRPLNRDSFRKLRDGEYINDQGDILGRPTQVSAVPPPVASPLPVASAPAVASPPPVASPPAVTTQTPPPPKVETVPATVSPPKTKPAVADKDTLVLRVDEEVIRAVRAYNHSLDEGKKGNPIGQRSFMEGETVIPPKWLTQQQRSILINRGFLHSDGTVNENEETIYKHFPPQEPGEKEYPGWDEAFRRDLEAGPNEKLLRAVKAFNAYFGPSGKYPKIPETGILPRRFLKYLLAESLIRGFIGDIRSESPIVEETLEHLENNVRNNKTYAAKSSDKIPPKETGNAGSSAPAPRYNPKDARGPLQDSPHH